jgi:hypothetical protein
VAVVNEYKMQWLHQRHADENTYKYNRYLPVGYHLIPLFIGE